MYYSIYFHRYAVSGIESRQADLLNAGHLEPMPPDHAWWFNIPSADVSRVLDYIFLAFSPMDVELFEQCGENQHSICYIVDHRRYWTLEPADLEQLADRLRASITYIPDYQYYELLDDLHSANADGMPTWYLADLFYAGLNPPQRKTTIIALLDDLSDIYHHPDDYVDDPSQIPVPSRNYFEFKGIRREF